MLLALVLGGTTEGRALAAALADRPGLRVVSSLAGRVAAPLRPPGEVRVGGFGGADGLAAWLREESVDVVVDATHPFAARISASAVAACTAAGVPLVALRRPGWAAVPGDRWHRVASLPAAAALVPRLGRRALLTTGRLGLAAFAGVDGVEFLVRTVERPSPPLPPRAELLLARGPFTVDGELSLLRSRGVDVVVTKDSGGAATAPKLVAARRLGLPVVLVDRPPPPPAAPGVAVVSTVADALARLAPLLHAPDAVRDDSSYGTSSHLSDER